MKNYLYTIVFSIFYGITYSQSNLIEGDVIDPKIKGDVYKIINHNQNNFFVIRKEKSNYYLEKYSNLTMSFESSVLLEATMGEYDYFDLKVINDKMVLFTIFNDKDRKEVVFFSQYLNEDGTSTLPFQLAKVKKMTNKGYMHMGLKDFFSINISPDQKKLLLVTFNHHNQMVKKMAYVYSTASMNLTWEGDVTEKYNLLIPENYERKKIKNMGIPTEKNMIENLQNSRLALLDYDVIGSNGFVIDNDGKIISIAYSSSMYSYLEPRYLYVNNRGVVTTIDINPSKTKVLNPDNSGFVSFYYPYTYNGEHEDFKLAGMRQFIDGDTLILSGYFREMEDKTIKIDRGTFSLIVNLKTLSKSIEFNYFPENLSPKFFDSQTPSCNFFAHQVVKDNSGFYLVGETAFFKAGTQTSFNFGGSIFDEADSHPYYDQTYFGTIVTKLDFSGKQLWTKVLPKKNNNLRSSSPSVEIEGSYYFAFTGNEINIFQYEHIDNKNIDLDSFSLEQINSCNGINDALIAYYNISSDGKINRYYIGNDLFKIKPTLSGSKKIINNIFYSYDKNAIIYFNTKGNEHFGKLKLK